jgi:hypothetical protein
VPLVGGGGIAIGVGIDGGGTERRTRRQRNKETAN